MLWGVGLLNGFIAGNVDPFDCGCSFERGLWGQWLAVFLWKGGAATAFF